MPPGINQQPPYQGHTRGGVGWGGVGERQRGRGCSSSRPGETNTGGRDSGARQRPSSTTVQSHPKPAGHTPTHHDNPHHPQTRILSPPPARYGATHAPGPVSLRTKRRAHPQSCTPGAGSSSQVYQSVSETGFQGHSLSHGRRGGEEGGVGGGGRVAGFASTGKDGERIQTKGFAGLRAKDTTCSLPSRRIYGDKGEGAGEREAMGAVGAECAATYPQAPGCRPGPWLRTGVGRTPPWPLALGRGRPPL